MAEFILAQDGWLEVNATDTIPTRVPRMVKLPVTMTRGCRYSIDTRDPRCAGCKHNQGAACIP